MGSVDRVDERTFKVNFSVDGAGKLREKVKEKLKEFMGDYTDDTLVEYVIVLLRNGRRKEEARNELNVFLGDDSESFVSWLWDHLASNLDLYVEPLESANELPQTKLTDAEQGEKVDSHHLTSDLESGKLNRVSRSRRNREWKGLDKEKDGTPSFQRHEMENVQVEEKSHCTVNLARQSLSPEPQGQRKRRHRDEHHDTERETGSQARIVAPRRLLQSAVRDAVGTSRPSGVKKEPSLKRLRSVVSTPTGDSSVVDKPRRLQSVARVSNPMATVIKAVAEAAKDAMRVRSSSVFDRLGHDVDISESSGQPDYDLGIAEDEDFRSSIQNQLPSTYLQTTDYSDRDLPKEPVFVADTLMASNSVSGNDRVDDVNILGHRVTNVSQPGTSGQTKTANTLITVSKENVADRHVTKKKEQDRPSIVSNTPHKIVNMSVNVNPWTLPRYQIARPAAEIDSESSFQESDVGNCKPGVRVLMEDGNSAVRNGNANAAADARKIPQKPLPSAGGHVSAARPLEDAESRTIFVSNVHFAATKDSISRHFNKFGEVLKVIISTDPNTGQPKGSAYVEFMRKDAAEDALSLDGTSFMSRILKVVRKGDAQREAASALSWPQVSRGSPFAAGWLTQPPRPWGIHAAFRPRPPINPGPRSLQWKRDAPATRADTGSSAPAKATFSGGPRSLTYVRPETKPEGSSIPS